MTTSKSKSAAKAPKKHKYRLMFVPEALAEYRALDGSISAVLKPLLGKRLDEPRVPGGELHGELSNCYKIKLRKQGVRLVYQVEDDKLIVMVLAVDKREDNAVYKSAVERLGVAVAALSKTVKTALKKSTK
ncbi:type II toxin-antitoxin system RelE family toxin [Delftia acidovorans]|uniref:type II toxin-antitoxin system RelE family toxin n=1 Tax=Delftia acidovorans TaxID=80866 RepID=UPI003D12A40A